MRNNPVRIPSDIYEKIRKYAFKHRISMTETIRQAWQAFENSLKRSPQ